MAQERAVMVDVTKFFAKVINHYSYDAQAGESEEKKMLANAT